MSDAIDEELELLRQSVARFVQEVASLADHVRKLADGVHGTSEAVWRGMADLGLPGLLIAETEGGGGLGMEAMGAVLEELGGAVHPGPFIASAVTATTLIQRALPEGPARAALLAELARGTRKLTAGLHEAGGPGDAAFVRATFADAEGGPRVHGIKTPVPDVADCDGLIVSARPADEDHGRTALFLVSTTAPGVRATPIESLDPTRKLFDVALEAAPAERLDTDAQVAEAAIEAAVLRTAAALVMDAVGAADRALSLCCDYARARVQFDRPIGAFQAIQHKLVDMLQRLELSRAAGHHALTALDREGAEAAARAVALAKAQASEALPRLGADAIQVHGGVGFTWEMDIHLYYKRLLSAQLLFGDARHWIARYAALVLPKSGPGD